MTTPIFSQFRANGTESVAAPVDQAAWGLRVAHMRAPEGTLVEFCAY
ncbi:hypothetical protein [Actinospica sp.]|jgi:hypothetical protein|nr:hypothetical protein [Actinospica sp.]HWG27018.1 hypothetical protein [Actinospica sp.]